MLLTHALPVGCDVHMCYVSIAKPAVLHAASSCLLLCRFEVVFMGAEARIDMQPSGEWLQQVTSSWTWPVSIKVLMLRSRLTAHESHCHDQTTDTADSMT